ncbi:MAG: hypothetical protein IKA04_11260 [Alistipes sp.]|nr:hypothetical protein [Alistipes sp.]
MKKLFISILALAAFAACQSDFNDVNLDAPQGGNANVGGSHTIYAEVGVGEEDTKATYGEGLKATWEENDQIALLQEHANYGATFSVVNKLNIKDGWGTSKALFNGDISVDATEPRVYHIAYPASAVSFSTTMSMTPANVSYEDSYTLPGYDDVTATGAGQCTYTSTMNITVPTTQSGKWEPYMYASTSEAVSSNAIGAKTLTTLTGAIAIRAFEANGVTPKQLKQITITSSDAAIAGAFSGTATSVGLTSVVSGASTGDKSNVFNDPEEIKGWALDNLVEVLKGLEPTSTSVTKAMSLSFAGSSKTITATNLDAIASDTDGKYTYHLNVAPFEGQDLTIELMDAKGLIMKCNVSAKSLSAGHRLGYEIKWVYEEASLTGEYIKTWYENPTDSFGFADNTIHVGKLEIVGNIEPENVIEMGVMVNDTLYGKETKTLSRPAFDIELPSGDYNVYAYAKVNLNGEEKILKAYEGNYTVTSIPTLTNYSVVSSYSKDGTVAKNNSIDGHLLKVTASLSDSYFVDNGLATIEVYNGNDKLGNITNGEWSNTNAALGQYSCYVKISFTNGYLITTQAHTTHVTGIPYYADWRSADYSDWIYSNVSDDGSRLSYKKSSNACIVSPAFHFPTSLSINSQIAATTNGTSTSDANKMYVSTGNRSSTYSKSGTTVTMDYNSSPSRGSDYDYIDCGNFTMSSSSPCLVYSHKNFFTCTTYLFRLKIVYVLE